MKMQKWVAVGMIAPVLALGPIGCETMSEHKVASGAAIGAATGAVAGAVIGHQSGNKGAGAAIGAATGALIGGGIGYYLDRRARRFEQVQDVQVEQVPSSSESSSSAPGEPAPAPQSEHIKLVINDTTLFEKNSAAVNQAGTAKLQQIATVLNEQPRERIIVRGYTSSDGADEYNQALSERRAENVRRTLIGYGVASERITAIGMGESNPIASNDTESGRAMNRRVEIEVFPHPDDVQKDSAK